jgi:uncharacterized protein YuzE
MSNFLGADDISDGVIELSEGVNLDTTAQGKLVGIEILTASLKMDINTILSYTLNLDKNILAHLGLLH